MRAPILTLSLTCLLLGGLSGCGGSGGPRSASSAAGITSNTASVSTFALTSLAPSNGSERGGVEVTLRGAGFGPGLSVAFDGVAARDVVVVSSETVVCKTPAHALGLVDVELTQGPRSAALPAGFEFTQAPSDRAGILDPTFAGRGFTTRDERGNGTSASYDYLYGVTSDALGRVVAVGESSLGRGGGTNRDLVVLRYLPDGTPDASFGSGGRVTHAGAAGGLNDWDKGEAVAIDSLGRIVVCGRSYNLGTPGDADLAVWRFLDNGSLDLSFAGRGFVTQDSAAGGRGWDSGQALAIDALGRIVIAGYSSLPLQAGQVLRDRQAVVWRLLTDGRFDGSFGPAGTRVLTSATSDEAWGVALDASGRVFVAGQVGSGAAQDVGLWCLEDNGTLDLTFGQGGRATHHDAAGGAGADAGLALALDAQGRALVAGRSVVAGGGTAMVVWRFNPVGALDLSFGGRGFALLDDPGGTPNAGDVAYGIAVAPLSGEIVVAGNAIGQNGFDATVWQLLPDGTTDARFAQGGVFQHDDAAGGQGTDQVRGLTLDADGRIVLVGSSSPGSGDADFALWRLR